MKIKLLLILTILIFISDSISASQDNNIYTFFKKSSILLLGQMLDDQAFNNNFQDLDSNNSDDEKKSHIIDYLMSRPEFYRNIEMILREEYLESLTKNEFIEIYLKDAFQLNEVRKQSVYWYDIHRFYVNKFELARIMSNQRDSSINIRNIQYLLIDNHIYSQINMGDDNFIISTFQHFIKRYPTKYEIAEAKRMLRGQPAMLFSTYGYGKIDYIHLLLNNSSYWENQIIYWHNKLINRDPSEDEILKYLPYMKKYLSPEIVIKFILINNI